VWGIWHDGALAISAGGGYWMLRNLRAHPQATAHLEPAEGMVIVVEGMARAITDKERLKRVAEVYGPKYDMVDTAGDFVTTDIVPDRVYAWITRAGSDEYQATRFVWD
jgi:hypothetical protein